MEASYTVTPDKSRNLARVKMAGFFTDKDVQEFAATYRQVLTHLKAPGHLTLVDIKEMSIQAQEIVAAFAALLASPDVRSSKLAFVTSSSLSRLQAQRLTDRQGVEFFNNLPDAEDWLFPL